MGKAYIFVATVLILIFAGLAFTSSYLLRTEILLKERETLLEAYVVELDYLVGLSDALAQLDQIEGFEPLRDPLMGTTARIEGLSSEIAQSADENLFLINATDFNAAHDSIEDQAELIRKSITAILVARSVEDIRHFGKSLVTLINTSTSVDFSAVIAGKVTQLRWIETFVVNLTWVLLPVQALIYACVWKFLIAKIVARQKATYKELKQAKETALDQAERAIAADASKSQFLNLISHELRTPLNGSVGSSEELVSQAKHPTTKELSQTVFEKAEDLNVLLNEMIKLSDRDALIDLDFDAFMAETKAKQEKARKAHGTGASSDRITDRLKNMRILIADDNRLNRTVLNKLVIGLGGAPDVVEDGEEAYQAYLKNDYDLLLLDIQMPNKTGVEALLAIRDCEQDQSRRPATAIAVTANTLDHELESYKRAGFVHCLAKPLTKSRLATALSAHLA